MEPPPTEDPGAGHRPIGALAMVAAAVRHSGLTLRKQPFTLVIQVERAYRMYSTGDCIEATQSFNAEFWGPRTALFMSYIKNDLVERHWDGIFRGLAAASVMLATEVAVENGVPQAPKERVPLPASDPPSSPAQY